MDRQRTERVPEPSLLPATDQELQERPLGEDHCGGAERRAARGRRAVMRCEG